MILIERCQIFLLTSPDLSQAGHWSSIEVSTLKGLTTAKFSYDAREPRFQRRKIRFFNGKLG